MVTIGIDPHKDTHSAVMIDQAGRELSRLTAPATADGFGALIGWARDLASECVWVIEDCRHVSGPLERFLIDHGQSVARLAPHLMAGARHGVRQRGKSDPIDALAVARAALGHGLDALPVARLAGPELEIRLIATHRERLVRSRTRLINELRWQLHDLWPDWSIPARRLTGPGLQAQIQQRLARADRTQARVRIARDMIARIRELTRTITRLHTELETLVKQAAPHLLAETGIGVLVAAKLIGEIADIHRFSSDAKLARIAGCAPIPASSGRTNRYRLDRGGNRQLNHAIHTIALAKLSHDPHTAAYIARQRANGKTSREAIRNLKRHIIRRVYQLLKNPHSTPTTLCT